MDELIRVTCEAVDSGVEEVALRERAERMATYTNRLRTLVTEHDWQADEASLLLPDESLASIEAMIAKKKIATLKYVVVIGIGGSNLGAFALYNALRGSDDALVNDRLPKMIFADTVSTKLLATLATLLSSKARSYAETNDYDTEYEKDPHLHIDRKA